MNEIKKCLFCDCDLKYHNIVFYDRLAQTLFTCKKCMVRYVFFKNTKLAMYSIFVKIGNNIYMWNFSGIGKNSQIRFIPYIKDDSDFTHDYFEGIVVGRISVLEVEKLLITIENTPKITPDNIEQKLKTYLLFL